MKVFHITYYVNRDMPLLSGISVEAESIVLAIGKFLLQTEVSVHEIKYIIEL